MFSHVISYSSSLITISVNVFPRHFFALRVYSPDGFGASLRGVTEALSGSNSFMSGPSLFNHFSPSDALWSILTLFMKEKNRSTGAFDTGRQKRSSASIKT